MTSYIFFVVVSVVVLFFCGAAIYFWFKRKIYTRERFAFVALSACVSSFVLIVNIIAADASPIALFLGLLEYVKTGQWPSLAPQSTMNVVALVVLFGMWCGLVWVIFKHWDGGFSQQDTFDRKNQQDSQFINMGFNELIRIAKRKPAAQLYFEPPPERRPEDLSQVTNVPWHQLAWTLVKLNNNALVREDHDWHNQQGFWLATDKDTDQLVALKCAIEQPSDEQLRDFVDYVKHMAKPPQQLRLMIKTGDAPASITIAGQLIAIQTQQQLLATLIDFSEYYHDIKTRASDSLLIGSDTLTLNDTYTPARFSKAHDENQPDKNLDDAIDDWLLAPCHTQLAILGEYGQGKSSMALMLTQRLLGDGKTLPQRVPILIELRGRSPKTMTPADLFSVWANKYDISIRRLEALHQAGRLLLIFDGFDEMELVGDSQARLAHFRALWRFNHGNCKMIITGRPNLFLGDSEQKNALGLKHNSAGRLNCEAWTIEKFNMAEIRHALRAAPPVVQDGVVGAVANNPNLIDIASRPSLLQAMSLLWQSDLLPKDIDQLTSAKVMALFVELALTRQAEKPNNLADTEQRHGTESSTSAATSGRQQPQPQPMSGPEPAKNYMVIHHAERRFFMQGIAVHMMEHKGDTNQISSADLAQITERLARVCPQTVSNDISAHEVAADTRALPERIAESADFLDRLKDDVRTCGLLVNDVTDGTFRFSHKSFLEYLVADHVERWYSGDKTGDRDDDVAAIRTVIATRFPAILHNTVTSDYFAELVIERRAQQRPDTQSPQGMAEFLLDYMLKPSWLTRQRWQLSWRLLTIKWLNSDKLSFWGGYCRGYLYPIISLPLRPFALAEKFKGKTKSAKQFSQLATTWSRICRAKGCELPQLYSVLVGKPIDSAVANRDPAGLLTPADFTAPQCKLASDTELKESLLNNVNSHSRINARQALINRYCLASVDKQQSLLRTKMRRKFSLAVLDVDLLVLPLPLLLPLVQLLPILVLLSMTLSLKFALPLPQPLPLLISASALLALALLMMALMLAQVLVVLLPLVLTLPMLALALALMQMLSIPLMGVILLLPLVSLMPLVLLTLYLDDFQDNLDREMTIYSNSNQAKYQKRMAKLIKKLTAKFGAPAVNQQFDDLIEYLGWDIRESYFPPRSAQPAAEPLDDNEVNQP